MIYLLDTDHVSIFQRGGELAHPLLLRLQVLPPDDYGTTIITYEEQCRGWTDHIHQARNTKERVLAYQCLSDNLRFFSRISVWDYSLEAEAQFTRLGTINIGTKDRRIAAIALATNATVLTRNRRDFDKIPELRTEDWTVEPNLDV